MNHYARTHIYIWRTGRNHRDVKSRATSRAKLCSIGRLASSMKVSDISSMVPTTRERGVFVPSTTGDHLFRSIQDENVGCTHDRQRRRRRRRCSPGWHRRSTSYLIENIIEWRVGKHAIGHAIGDKLREEWTSPFVVSFNPLANEARLQNAIRESGIERERESVYIRRIYPSTMWYGIMRSSKNRKFVTMVRGEANLEMSLPFSKSLAISTLSNHTRLIRSNFSSVYLHPSVLDALHFRNTSFFFFFFFWGEKDPTRFPSYCPASPGLRDTFGKVDHLESISIYFWIL